MVRLYTYFDTRSLVGPFQVTICSARSAKAKDNWKKQEEY